MLSRHSCEASNSIIPEQHSASESSIERKVVVYPLSPTDLNLSKFTELWSRGTKFHASFQKQIDVDEETSVIISSWVGFAELTFISLSTATTAVDELKTLRDSLTVRFLDGSESTDELLASIKSQDNVVSSLSWPHPAFASESVALPPPATSLPAVAGDAFGKVVTREPGHTVATNFDAAAQCSASPVGMAMATAASGASASVVDAAVMMLLSAFVTQQQQQQQQQQLLPDQAVSIDCANDDRHDVEIVNMALTSEDVSTAAKNRGHMGSDSTMTADINETPTTQRTEIGKIEQIHLDIDSVGDPVDHDTVELSPGRNRRSSSSRDSTRNSVVTGKILQPLTCDRHERSFIPVTQHKRANETTTAQQVVKHHQLLSTPMVVDARHYRGSVVRHPGRHRRSGASSLVAVAKEENTCSVGVKMPYVCRTCGKYFWSEQYAIRHMQMHSDNGIGPTDNDARPDTQSVNVKKQLQSLKSGNSSRKKIFSCNDCGKQFCSVYSMQAHQKRLHATAVDDRAKQLVCNICGKRFGWLSSLNAHRMRFHTADGIATRFVCGVCGRRYRWRSTLFAHQRRRTCQWPAAAKKANVGDKLHQCESCGKCFGKVSYLQSHMQLHSPTQRYKCTVCGYSSHWKYKLRRHVCRRRPRQNADDVSSSRTAAAAVEMLPTTMVEEQLARAHVRLETTLQWTDKSAQHISNNIDDNDNAETLQNVDEKAKFSGTAGMDGMHSSAVGGGGSGSVNQFSRGNYGKRFMWQNNLCRHQKNNVSKQQMDGSGDRGRGGARTSEVVREKPFSCKICGKHFTRLGILEVHRKWFHARTTMKLKKQTKLFACSVCGKHFSRFNSMRVHREWFHTSDRTAKHFMCSVCGKRYRWLSGLHRHERRRKCHRQKTADRVKQDTTNRGDKNDEAECFMSNGEGKQFSCNDWGKPFSTSDSQQVDSELQQRLDCSICSKHFRHIRHVRIHMTKVHGTHGQQQHEYANGSRKSTEQQRQAAGIGGCKPSHRRTSGKTSQSRVDKGVIHTVVKQQSSGCEAKLTATARTSYKTGKMVSSSLVEYRNRSCSPGHGKLLTGQSTSSSQVTCANEGQGKFSCIQCGFSFTRLRGLSHHIRQSHVGASAVDGTGKLKVCEKCGKCFSATYLRRHELSHTGEKLYVCETCGSQFAQHSNWKTHVARKSCVAVLLTKTESTASEVEVLMPFGCGICGRAFATESETVEHFDKHGSDAAFD